MTNATTSAKKTTAQIIAEFNKPYKTAVAINCDHIGDDNDYSCVLFVVARKLWAAGEKQLAVTMANTDSMRLEPVTVESFEIEFAEWQKFQQESDATAFSFDLLTSH
jgi:hypothetical protein